MNHHHYYKPLSKRVKRNIPARSCNNRRYRMIKPYMKTIMRIVCNNINLDHLITARTIHRSCHLDCTEYNLAIDTLIKQQKVLKRKRELMIAKGTDLFSSKRRVVLRNGAL